MGKHGEVPWLSTGAQDKKARSQQSSNTFSSLAFRFACAILDHPRSDIAELLVAWISSLFCSLSFLNDWNATLSPLFLNASIRHSQMIFWRTLRSDCAKMRFQAVFSISLSICRFRVSFISSWIFLPRSIFSWFLFITRETINSLASLRCHSVYTASWIIDVIVHCATLRSSRTTWRKIGRKMNITICEKCWQRLRKRNWKRLREHEHDVLRLQCSMIQDWCWLKNRFCKHLEKDSHDYLAQVTAKSIAFYLEWYLDQSNIKRQICIQNKFRMIQMLYWYQIEHSMNKVVNKKVMKIRVQLTFCIARSSDWATYVVDQNSA